MDNKPKNTAIHDERMAKSELSMLKAIKHILLLQSELKKARHAGYGITIPLDVSATDIAVDLAIAIEDTRYVWLDLTSMCDLLVAECEQKGLSAKDSNKIKKTIGN